MARLIGAPPRYLGYDAEGWLAARGYDPDFGARPLRRVLQREAGDRLAVLLLQGDFEGADTIRVDVAGDQLSFC